MFVCASIPLENGGIMITFDEVPNEYTVHIYRIGKQVFRVNIHEDKIHDNMHLADVFENRTVKEFRLICDSLAKL